MSLEWQLLRALCEAAVPDPSEVADTKSAGSSSGCCVDWVGQLVVEDHARVIGGLGVRRDGETHICRRSAPVSFSEPITHVDNKMTFRLYSAKEALFEIIMNE